jgi:hypothetical protein
VKLKKIQTSITQILNYLNQLNIKYFVNLKAKQNLELRFGSSLEQIDSDAFNGLIIEPDVELVVYIEGRSETMPIGEDQSAQEEDDDVDDRSSQEWEEKSVYLSGQDDKDAPLQLEYDLVAPSTKPNPAKRKKRETDAAKAILNVHPHAFRGLVLKQGATFTLKLSNLNHVQLSQRSLTGLRQLSASSVYLSLENKPLFGSELVVLMELI